MHWLLATPSAWLVWCLSILLQELEERIVVKAGKCSEDALQHKRVVLSLCLGNSYQGVATIVQLMLVCNGDWRNTSVVESYWNPASEAEPNASMVVNKVVSCIMQTLAASRPHVYPRSRWTGFKQAVVDLALLEAVHGLLVPTYKRLCGMLNHGAKAKATDIGVDTSSGQVPSMLSSLQPTVDDVHEDDLAAASEQVLPTSFDDSGGGALVQDNHVSFQEANDRDRKSALEWLSSMPMGHMYLILICLEPLE
eukprot:3146983-Amphidinium_carterae.1